METNRLTLTPTIPTPQCAHWTTSEGAGSEYMLDLPFPNHPIYSPSFNFTDTSLQSYQSAHLVPPLAGQQRNKTVSNPLAPEPSHAPPIQRHFGSHENTNVSSPNGPHYHIQLPLGKQASPYLKDQLADDRENADQTGLKPPTKML
ncbi:hypothetical protein N7530_012722 [Penicillium desertorum]|uniref:Uncharacterized protein n=1 Tax=Penicillium desertorum TaxID=1303715 RepID=A0A9W9WDR3_9EURO|nr:hypothetical protein N7530_012722 [Penicillium desertorum]